ncbi:MAG: cytidylate kinase-like family protein [Bryobacteraceae bacterium]|jgi:cytidylate kinase
MYRVLTISREYGSAGIYTARMIANKLGWKLLDSELIDAIVEQAKVDPKVAERFDERVDPWLHRISRKALWHGAFEGVAELDDTAVFDAHTMAILTKRIIQEVAEIGGCVVVGRGAQCLLASRADTFHAFVYAPRALRLENLRKRLPDVEDLERAMDTVDRRRADYIRLNYDRDMYNPQLYDLMVNTRVGIEAAVRIMLFAMGHGE